MTHKLVTILFLQRYHRFLQASLFFLRQLIFYLLLIQLLLYLTVSEWKDSTLPKALDFAKE